MLTADDFGTFFREVHGYPPFPWQQRLLVQVASKGQWPGALDLPTGSGKTAAIDIALFHLALEADRLAERRAPVRIAFVVDRRLVVDDAFERARRLEAALAARLGDMTARVAQCLEALSGDGPPLIARRLRGGIPREEDWARTPSQPTVLCSTVDQIGSRLLFRGYGVSDSMKPVHAGLIGSDCLILLDEAHLAEPFRQTAEWVERYRGKHWREQGQAAPWGLVCLTATPGSGTNAAAGEIFLLSAKDSSNPVLRQRLEAAKPAFLVAPARPGKAAERAAEADDEEGTADAAKALARRVLAIVEAARKARKHFESPGNGAPNPAIGIVVNRVGRAREVFKELRKAYPETSDADGAPEQSPEIILMIGPARPADRDELAGKLQPIRTGESRALERPLILVATQCIEAGVDIDLDALITEAAPLDSLRQRFGRLNRAGRKITPYAAIVADKSDLSAKADDPVYGKAIKPAWDYLTDWAKESNTPAVDFGVGSVGKRLGASPPPAEASSEKPDAPVLLPAHLDLLSQTAPIPAADPEVALYLHGPNRQPDSITVVWRADIHPGWKGQDLIRLLTLVPPRSPEAIELPLWTVRSWLGGRGSSAADMADLPARAPDDGEGPATGRVFRWRGDDERSQWIDPAALRPGDTIIVPGSYGGVDEFGWNPQSAAPATDLAQKAARPFAPKRFAARVAPGLLGPGVSDAALATTLARLRTENAETVRQTLLELGLPAELEAALRTLENAKGKPGKARLSVDFDLYGENGKGEPRGVVLLAPFGAGTRDGQKGTCGDEDGRPNSTEDDAAGSIFDSPLSLEEHSRDVEDQAEEFAIKAGLPPQRTADLKLAGSLHDLGKGDPRFQAWLHFGDPLGVDGDEKSLLAKSGRTLPPLARARSGLPDRWRHEALSVRLARTHPSIASADDPDLVLWLVGSHHGYGRPFFPHRDPEETAPDIGPQSLAFDWNGLDWPSLFARLKARYGIWELARMEAILRLADHRASEAARDRPGKEPGE